MEDELPSRNKLKRFLEQLDEPIQLVKELDSVESGIAFFSTQPKIDLLISDIELLDGNAFQIFEEIEIPCPIIFTTAYNQFWMQAFEGNGIEYLLKPFNFDRFQKAWNKFAHLTKSKDDQADLLKSLHALLGNQQSVKPTFKTRISIPTHKGSYFLSVEEICLFTAENSVVWAVDQLGKKHLLQEPTLKEIEETLNPDLFFRISRSHLVQKQFVQGMERYTKNSIAIKMIGLNQLVVCSQSATSRFLKWIATS